ncbi:MAG TPA: endonuclease V [Pseudomonadales bacterium]
MPRHDRPNSVPRAPHRWRLAPRAAVAVQNRLRDRVRIVPGPKPRRIVGLDCAFAENDVLAVAVVWDVVGGRVLETRGARRRVDFPYVPGLLSFREVPVMLDVLRRLTTSFDAVMCDGQGIAHPRRLGLASHLGVILQMPTLGCAKSRLLGSHAPVGRRRGDWVPLLDGDERVGTVLRTRDDVRPVFVSPGNLCNHDDAVGWVLACGGGYRLPEPTRLADRHVAAYKRQGSYRGGLTS